MSVRSGSDRNAPMGNTSTASAPASRAMRALATPSAVDGPPTPATTLTLPLRDADHALEHRGSLVAREMRPLPGVHVHGEAQAPGVDEPLHVWPERGEVEPLLVEHGRDDGGDDPAEVGHAVLPVVVVAEA